MSIPFGTFCTGIGAPEVAVPVIRWLWIRIREDMIRCDMFPPITAQVA